MNKNNNITHSGFKTLFFNLIYYNVTPSVLRNVYFKMNPEGVKFF